MTDRTLSLGLTDGSPDELPPQDASAGVVSSELSSDSPGAANTAPLAAVGGEQDSLARCSFCGLGEGEVERLFQGRAGYICGECVDVCVELLADYREMGLVPPESKRSWYQRWFSEDINVACSFTPHDDESPQGERLFPGQHVQICEQCVRACAVLKSGETIDTDA